MLYNYLYFDKIENIAWVLSVPLCEGSQTVVKGEWHVLPEVIEGQVVKGGGKHLVVLRREGGEAHTEGVPGLQHHFRPSQHLTTPAVGGEEAAGTVISLR